MLSPTDRVPLEQWCASVEKSVLALTDADAAVLVYPEPRPDGETLRNEEAEDEGGPTSGIRFGCPPTELIARGVAGVPEEHEGMHEAVSMFVRLQGEIESWLTVYARQPRGGSFQARTAERLRSVLPAFRFSARARWDFGIWRTAFANVLDAMKHPVLLCSETGRVIHANDSLGRLYTRDPGAAGIRGAMEQAARRLARAHATDPDPGPIPDRDVNAGNRVFRLRARWVEGSAADGAATILVFADAQPRPAPEADWAERYGLTERERQIAELLGRGQSNREIADALKISHFTVQNHVRRVLAKLDVRSRAAVATRLSS